MPSEYALLFASTAMEVIVVLLVGFEVIVGEIRHRAARSARVTSAPSRPEPGVLLSRRIGLRTGAFVILASGIIWGVVYLTFRASLPPAQNTSTPAPAQNTSTPAPITVIHDPPTAEEIAKAGGDALRAAIVERDAFKEQNNLLRQKVPNPPPPPAPPRSKPLISDLLAESGALLDIVEKTIIPLENEWRNSLGGQNPERICLSLSSRGLQDQISSIAERLRTADKDISDVLKQNRIDRGELVPLIGYAADVADPDESPLLGSAYQIENYGKTIKQLGEHPTCDDVIKMDIGRRYFEMNGVLNGFNTQMLQAKERLSNYRDALRKELRNAP